MTGSALIAKSAGMSIILGMARGAVHGRAFEDAVDMTTRTSNSGVFPVKVERELRVIYISRFPAGGRMAGCAISPKLPLVSIILLMAGETILRSGFQVINAACIDMTGRTFHRRVLADQIEWHFIMIKSFAVRFHAIMTGHAVCTKCQEVLSGKGLIDLQVAVTTRSLIERRSVTFYVAILTSCSFM
jgi:hypothetical protein